jgi:hypothetical protein
LHNTSRWTRGFSKSYNCSGHGNLYTDVITLCYDFYPGGLSSVTDGNTPCNYSNNTPTDNGSVYQIQNLADNNRTQNFTDDRLNRIQE